jgi:hypothetical protein
LYHAVANQRLARILPSKTCAKYATKWLHILRRCELAIVPAIPGLQWSVGIE